MDIEFKLAVLGIEHLQLDQFVRLLWVSVLESANITKGDTVDGLLLVGSYCLFTNCKEKLPRSPWPKAGRCAKSSALPRK